MCNYSEARIFSNKIKFKQKFWTFAARAKSPRLICRQRFECRFGLIGIQSFMSATGKGSFVIGGTSFFNSRLFPVGARHVSKCAF